MHRRLEDHGAAGRERRRRFLGAERERAVEGRDQDGDADRLAALQDLADAKKTTRADALLGMMERLGRTEPSVAGGLARLLPMPKPRRPRRPGGWQGKVRMSDDFNAPLPDELLDAFEGRRK